MSQTRFQPRHPWEVTPQEAIAIQEQLRGEVIRSDQFAKVEPLSGKPVLRTVAGVDVGFEAEGSITRAAVVVLSFPGLHLLHSAIARRPTTFPYVPGLLSFREVPAVLEALTSLSELPDLLLVDGQGVAHPRRLGIASHLGLLCDLPSIGVAKSILVGRHKPVADEFGAWQPLRDGGEVVGAALRTRPGVRPVYVSVGHRLSLETAIDLVLQCSRGFRLPEPIRQAHRLASQA